MTAEQSAPTISSRPVGLAAARLLGMMHGQQLLPLTQLWAHGAEINHIRKASHISVASTGFTFDSSGTGITYLTPHLCVLAAPFREQHSAMSRPSKPGHTTSV